MKYIIVPVLLLFSLQVLSQECSPGYRITIGVWFFAGTILSSLVTAWLTVGYIAIKAAIANPVRSLRTE
jgi:hypothetical protein